jgi:hypothetical protein
MTQAQYPMRHYIVPCGEAKHLGRWDRFSCGLNCGKRTIVVSFSRRSAEFIVVRHLLRLSGPACDSARDAYSVTMRCISLTHSISPHMVGYSRCSYFRIANLLPKTTFDNTPRQGYHEDA